MTASTHASPFEHGVVCSPHALASASGLAVLRDGGNALDAAVATNLTLGVVAPYSCGFGGDLFAIVWRDGVAAYNGSGRTPAAMTAEVVRAAAGDAMPERGPLPVTVPGAVEAWFSLLDRFGTRSFGQLANDALRYARDGFPITELGAESIAEVREEFAGSAAWQAVYGEIHRLGDVLQQPDLARTIQALADEGPDVYYRGPIAAAIAEAVSTAGGLVTTSDLAEHRGEWVEPLSARYRDVDVLELPPNTQGVAVLEALRILDELGPLPPDGLDRQHRLIEVTKLALADRDAYVTDPEHMRINPAQLLSASWVRERAASFDPTRAREPVRVRSVDGGTAYLCAADSGGMLVSLIQSNFLGFGSGRHGAEVGHQSPRPWRDVLARRRPSERRRAAQTDAAHAHSGVRAPRRCAVARVRDDGRARAGADPRAAPRARRRRPRGRAERHLGSEMVDRSERLVCDGRGPVRGRGVRGPR